MIRTEVRKVEEPLVGSNGAASERGGKRTRGMTGKEHQNDGDHAAACEETASEG